MASYTAGLVGHAPDELGDLDDRVVPRKEGCLVPDLLFVLLTVALFILALVVRGAERL